MGLVGALLLTGMLAQGSISWTSGVLNTPIPDNNPVGIWSATSSLGSSGQFVTGITVGLNVSGGFNSDLYAYLVSPTGTLVTLLNQPATAYGSSMNVTLLSSGGANGNLASAGSGALTGSYTVSGLSAFETGSVAANGAWTLFFADLSAGGTSKLNGWSLDLTVVPEPVAWALGIFGMVLGTGLAIRERASLRKLATRINAWLDAV